MKTILFKISCILLFFFCLAQGARSQVITVADKKKLLQKEDTLREYAQYMITDSLTEDRMYSDSIFTKIFVRALQIKNSFYYPFDSVFGISRLYAPDSTFRIFTWNLQYDDRYSRQRGAIQMRTKDGSLKLIPLRDISEFTDKPEDSVRNRLNWIGAIYYNIIKTQFKGKNYYTLFGFDHNDVMSSKKWVEVLQFNEKNEPVFGGPFFSYEQDSVPGPVKNRISLEFKKDARVLANYVPELDMILLDHLISDPSNPANEDPANKWTFVPDGDNEGFKWENGKWMHIDKVFTFKLQDGQAPVGDQLMDSKGNKNEFKLQQKTDSNKTKEPPKVPVKKNN